MGKGGERTTTASTSNGVADDSIVSKKDYSATEVSKHSGYKTKQDSWLVFQGNVYDISNFAGKHPGGWELIITYEGQDATTVMERFHPELDKLQKYLKPLHKGTCKELLMAAQDDPIMNDFNELTAKLYDQGYFESSKLFFALVYLHIVALEVLAWYLVAYHSAHQWGAAAEWAWGYLHVPQGWIGFLLLAVIQGTACAQAGWLQHDAGHKSIFANDVRRTFWAQQLTM